MTARTRRAGLLAGCLVVVVVAIVIWAIGGRGDGGRPTSAPSTRATAVTSAPPTRGGASARATGAGSCAFLSTDDVARAAGVAQVELRQNHGPSGGPGCEWVPGGRRAPLQLEFVDATAGPAPTVPEGEDVPGPWEQARWVADTRSLYVRGSGLFLLVRAGDSDPARAKTVATKVAMLAIERS